MYELVIIWINGDKDIWQYGDRDSAEKAGAGMEMAMGQQIEWWGVRPVLITTKPRIHFEQLID